MFRRNSACGTSTGLLYCISVKFWSISKHQRNSLGFAAVAVMFSLWVMMWVLELSPDLHRFLHNDAQSPVHHCLVTQLQHNLVASGFLTAVAPTPPQVSHASFGSGECQIRFSYDYRLTPSRAPPAV
jgi:hypothetical protein